MWNADRSIGDRARARAAGPIVALAAWLAGGLTASAGYALTGLASFQGDNGANSYAALVRDAAGNLYGTTSGGPVNSFGTIFEVVAGTSTPIVLAKFNGANGANPFSELVVDAAGNLYGTTVFGGASGSGTVFELAAGSNTPTVLASFNGTNGANSYAGLVRDAAGNLFGTTSAGGANGFGTIFELAAGSSTPTALASFDGAHGNSSFAALVRDAEGNLYGTTAFGGAKDLGTVFELAHGASTPTVLASFDRFHGNTPFAALYRDAEGNLFGTTSAGGANGLGTIFMVSPGLNTPIFIASFDGANGRTPYTNLLADASGNLFGTTTGGGANDRGTVFELALGSDTPTTLFSFDFKNGAYPLSGLVMDPAGHLYGTTSNGGSLGVGTFYALSPSHGENLSVRPGYVVSPSAVPEPSAWLLLGIGGAALAGRSAWRKRAASAR